MPLQSLVNTFQKLTIATGRSSVKINTLLQNTDDLIKCTHIREFKSSAISRRKLDSHRGPKWEYPSSKNNRWVPFKKATELYEYTTQPVPLPQLKTGGRGPNGRTWYFRRGGGGKKLFRMIDWIRGGTDKGQPLLEKVEMIYHDPNRTAKIALVAAGERKRYIIATANMKVGDLIKSSKEINPDIVKANEGDSYPISRLPIGSFVNCVQILPNSSGKYACAAGVSAILVRKIDDKVVVRLPSKREMLISGECTATVGRVSNIHNDRIVFGKAGRNRWRGIRPKSGRWHRKDGRFGRKLHGPRPMMIIDGPPSVKAKPKRLTLSQAFFVNP